MLVVYPSDVIQSDVVQSEGCSMLFRLKRISGLQRKSASRVVHSMVASAVFGRKSFLFLPSLPAPNDKHFKIT
jgi:hypothetical protein